MHIKKQFFLIILMLSSIFSTNIKANSLNQDETITTLFTEICIGSQMSLSYILPYLSGMKKRELLNYERLDKETVETITPGAEDGFVLRFQKEIYIITLGMREQSKGGQFCSLAVPDVEYDYMKNLIITYFSSFKLEDEIQIGQNKIAAFKGYAPGFGEELGISIQVGFGLASISLFKSD